MRKISLDGATFCYYRFANNIFAQADDSKWIFRA